MSPEHLALILHCDHILYHNHNVSYTYVPHMAWIQSLRQELHIDRHGSNFAELYSQLRSFPVYFFRNHFFYDWNLWKGVVFEDILGSITIINYMAIPWNSNGSGIAMGSAAMPRCQKRDFAATGCSSGIDSELRHIATSRAKTSEKTTSGGYVAMYQNPGSPGCSCPKMIQNVCSRKNPENWRWSKMIKTYSIV